MRASHARRGGRQGHVEATEFGRLPRLTLLQQLRRDLPDGRLLHQRGFVEGRERWKGRPRAVDARLHFDEAAAAAEVVEHRGIRRGCIHRQGREEGASRGHRCVGSVEVIAVKDALLDAHAEGLEQADAGAGFVALEGLVEAGHVRAFRLDHPCQEAGFKQAIFEGGLTVFAKANGLRGGLVLLRKTVIDQADGGSAGHRLIRPRAGFEDGRDVPRHVR